MELPDRFYFTTRTNKKPLYMARLNAEGFYEVWLYPRDPLANFGVHSKTAIQRAVELGQWKIVDTNSNQAASLLLEGGGGH